MDGSNRSVATASVRVWLLFTALAAGRRQSHVSAARGHTGEQQTPDPRPNIVLVTCDSLDGRLTFGPQNQVVNLPNINIMKENGAVFLNTYSNSPICCPSRAALWSGLFVHLTKSWNNFKCLNPDYPTWMKVLQNYGYYTKVYGKTDYTSGHHSISNRVEAWTRDVKFLLRQEGRPTTVLIGNESTVRIMDHDWQNVDKVTEWIRYKAAHLNQPFVLSLGLNLPHPYPTPSMGEAPGGSTFKTSPYWLKKVNYESIRIPKWLSFSEMHPVDFYSSYTKNCTGNFTYRNIKDIRGFYYAMCAETDLMLDIAGISLPKNLSGYSLLPLLRASPKHIPAKKPRPDWIFSEFHGCNVNASTYMIRTGRWKYITYADGISVPSQLFDLITDPDELMNVASKYTKITSTLDKKLRSILNYPEVSKSVHQYNKLEFTKWKESLGKNYTNIIANLRWHQSWQKDPACYQNAIENWLNSTADV
ncbi:arylsulfatase K isoform X2 [Amblyraja radiata]|uniref:arylsulfatase K isoform X2 n=1 Tax=Amblyraja radiata TaxID=386614 RepID=UPI001402C97F|nr:arylsulfatase K isoform X2 [Amblyraja radiata]